MKGLLFGAIILVSVLIASVLFLSNPDRVSDRLPPAERENIDENSPPGITGEITDQADQSQEEEQNSLGCTKQQISYAVKNLRTDQECLVPEGENCLEKEIRCFFDVYNLDYEMPGNFGFRLYVVGSESNNYSVDSVYLEAYLNPRSNVTMGKAFKITGSDANKDLTCIYQKEEIPKKQVC